MNAFAGRRIQLLAPHSVRECKERLIAESRSSQQIGVADGDPIRLFVLPKGLRSGHRFVVEGACTLRDRSAATQVDLLVELTTWQKLAWSVAIPVVALVTTLFAWVLTSRTYEPLVLGSVIVLFGGYVAVLAIYIRRQLESATNYVSEDAAIFTAFISRTLGAVNDSEAIAQR